MISIVVFHSKLSAYHKQDGPQNPGRLLKLEDLPQNTKMFGKPIHGCHRDAYQNTSVFYPTNISHHYLGSVLGLFQMVCCCLLITCELFFFMCYPRILRIIIIIDYALDAYLGGPHFFAAGLASACSELFSWIKHSGGKPGRKTYPGNKDFVTSAYPIPSIPSIGELVHHFPYEHRHFPGSPCPVAPWVWVWSLAQLPPRRRGTSGIRSNVMG